MKVPWSWYAASRLMISRYRDCPAQDDPWVLEFYQEHKGDSPAQLVRAVVRNERMWGKELAALEGFEEASTAALEAIDRLGAYEAMQDHAMGAARRDPRRGEMPVMCASTVPDCRPGLGK